MTAQGDPDGLYRLEGMQTWIDAGSAWMSEGSVGRAAMEAIESGECVLGPEARRDYWGNRVPGRHDVTAGTLGSLEYANRLREERGWPAIIEIDGVLYEDGDRPDE